MDIRSTPENATASPTAVALRLGDEWPLASARRDAHPQVAPGKPNAISATEALALCMEAGCCGA